jgi:hypothetical protein
MRVYVDKKAAVAGTFAPVKKPASNTLASPGEYDLKAVVPGMIIHVLILVSSPSRLILHILTIINNPAPDHVLVSGLDQRGRRHVGRPQVRRTYARSLRSQSSMGRLHMRGADQVNPQFHI